ncbi:MAG: helix-turn-helix transcriptional regulator [Fimbriimonadales bacterium]|nr:helix-turn-helix transcriptional regulator [Fimbriimonadales bacterium]
MEPETAFERIAQLIGCKWSVRILVSLSSGVTRPSQILKQEDGLSARVMHRCLNRMEKDGLLQKTVLPEVPPHTEYELTDQGHEFVKLLTTVRDMATQWKGTQRPVKL